MKLKKLILMTMPAAMLAYFGPSTNQNYCSNIAKLATPKKETATQGYSALNPQQIEQIKRITIETIKNNPELISSQIKKFQDEKITKTQTRDQNLIKNNKYALLMENNNLGYGNKKSAFTIVEFIDYQCSHCKKLASTLRKDFATKGNVRVIVKELPILGKNSVNAAKAAIAASKQGKYTKFQNYLLTSNQAFTEENLMKAAKQIKLNMTRFKKDFASNKTAKHLDKNLTLAKKLIINATPTIVVTKTDGSKGKIIPGSLSSSEINKLLSSLR